jgi:hypothetical protein
MKAKVTSAKIVKRTKSLIRKEPLLNSLARQAGKAAGVITNAVQKLIPGDIALVKTERPKKGRKKKIQGSPQKNRKKAKSKS